MEEELTFVQQCEGLRASVKITAREVKEEIALYRSENAPAVGEVEDRSEMIANLTLAYRHLEDASMRLGKAIQAYDGGKSVYNKETTVGA
jgi:hypothetical protein